MTTHQTRRPGRPPAPSPRLRRSVLAVLALGAFAAAPAAASAASITVTGDDGSPVAVPAGAPPTIRNMKPDVGVAFPPGDGRYTLAATGPTGSSVTTGAGCSSHAALGPYRITYAGNGTYTVTLTNYAGSDTACATPTSTETYRFTLAASTSIPSPPAAFLLRAPGSVSTNALSLAIQPNPGADALEVHYAPNAGLAPDGSLAGPSARASADPQTGVAQLHPDAPGIYTVVARPVRSTSAGDVGGPWSPPVRILVAAPFDVSGGLQFLDARGPSYAVRIQLREKSARGRVTVSLARGSKGGTYLPVGSARISERGTVTTRFRATRAGSYRLRFTYRGSATIVGGRVTFPIKVSRRSSFG